MILKWHCILFIIGLGYLLIRLAKSDSGKQPRFGAMPILWILVIIIWIMGYTIFLMVK